MSSAERPGDLEAELRALGASLDVPAPPPDQMAAAVRDRLEALTPHPENHPPRQATPRPFPWRRVPAGDGEQGRRPFSRGRAAGVGGRWRSWGRRWKVVVVVVLAVAAVTAATPQGREAVIAVLRHAGIELRLGSATPAPVTTTPTPPDARTVPPDEVRTGYPTALGAPERVTVSDDGRVVSMFWRGGIRFDRINGIMDPYFFKKLGPPFPDYVEVNGVTGWWIRGEHPLGYITRDDGAEVPLRQAGPTLVWQSGATGYRLEGVASLARATELARSLR